MSTLCVIGAGRSGAVSAAGLAELGHTVRAIDIDAARVATLNEGRAPFFEPDLDDMTGRNVKEGRLSFTTSYQEGLTDAGFVLLCVDTPAQDNGEANLSSLLAAVETSAPLLVENAIVITRSTVPVGTNASLIDAYRKASPDATFEVVSNPEFLREGHAVEDFMRPDRIVIGSNSSSAAKAVAGLYDGIDCPKLIADLETAELAKYAANAHLAASVSFINEIANICDRTGADVSVISQALRLDKRIGERAYLDPGIGFGGSCLPKDLSALITTAGRTGYDAPLLHAIRQVNEEQAVRVVAQLKEIFPDLHGIDVAVLGVSFKGETFDARSSPALSVIRLLDSEGAHVRAHDPFADESASTEVGSLASLFDDAYATAEGSKAIIIATDHSVFRDLDLKRLRDSMKAPVFIDGRNLFDPEAVTKAGFSYVGVGRARPGE